MGSRDRAAAPSIGNGNRETVVRDTTFMKCMGEFVKLVLVVWRRRTALVQVRLLGRELEPRPDHGGDLGLRRVRDVGLRRGVRSHAAVD